MLKKAYKYYENLYNEDDNFRDIILLETLLGQKILDNKINQQVTQTVVGPG